MSWGQVRRLCPGQVYITGTRVSPLGGPQDIHLTPAVQSNSVQLEGSVERFVPWVRCTLRLESVRIPRALSLCLVSADRGGTLESWCQQEPCKKSASWKSVASLVGWQCRYWEAVVCCLNSELLVLGVQLHLWPLFRLKHVYFRVTSRLLSG